MITNLDNRDFQKIVDVIEKINIIQDPRERSRMLCDSFSNNQEVINQINFYGSTRSFIVGLIRRLSTFGRIAEGEDALGIFLSSIIPYLEKDEAEFIKSVLVKYKLNTPATSENITEWRGNSASLNKERVIRTSNSIEVRSLGEALEAANAVVRVRVEGTSGRVLATGFFIAPDMIITPHHVISDQMSASTAVFDISYQTDSYDQLESSYTIMAAKNGLFYTNKKLDFSIIQISNLPSYIKPLHFENVSVRPNEPIVVIGHPSGLPKKVSLYNNFIVYVDEKIIQYTSDTSAGSSGAPIFNQNIQVIAIHQAVMYLNEPTTSLSHFRNQGTRIGAIMEDIKSNSPEIYELILEGKVS